MNANNTPPEPDAVESLLLRIEAEEGFGLDRIPRAAPRDEPESTGEGLAHFEKKAQACTACSLYKQRDRLVFGAGNPQADLMFVGEAPGYDEDREGVPFVGKAGQLLTRMIKAMGFTREEVYIANVLKCHPPKNRTPVPKEISACRTFLEEQIRIISPRIIVALGAPASKTLLDSNQGISALRGRAFPYKGMVGIQIIPTFHPAYLLRNESEKGKVWKDLQLAMAILQEKK